MTALTLSFRNWKLVVFVCLLLTAAAIVLIIGWRIQELTKERAIRELERQYSRRVDLESLTFRPARVVLVSGRKLVVHGKGPGTLPFISVESFSARIPYWSVLRGSLRLDSVELKGLRINVPARGDGANKVHETAPPRRATLPPDFVIEDMVADGTVLSILPKRPGGDPLVFEIQRLKLRSVGISQPMRFQTILMNAKPPGLIHSDGQFGPWRHDEPGLTLVSGSYTFKDANLGVFKGLSGTLSSTGHYTGVLQRIVVDGETDTPDFALDVSRHPVRLTTQFHAIVDGTNGDTLLEPITAQFLDTSLTAQGGVVGAPGRKGKSVRLDVSVSESRVEDLLTLAIKTEDPPLMGGILFSTRFDLPPGPEDIVQRLNLDGHFGISSARFTDFDVQKKVAELSHRARGRASERIRDERVVSDLSGEFHLGDGVARLANLSFCVPGASVTLDGDFGLLTEALDFRGKLRMDAKLSQATTGVKSVFLKVVDPFFRKNGKTVLPIKITGTLDQPSFGLDL
jgi:hypothetical protein